MMRERARVGNALGVLMILAGVTAVGGCGSDAGAAPSPVKPSGPLLSSGDPPPPPRPQTKEECDGCYGLWAVHGIEPVETCICLTSDGGQFCTDGRECEGQCLVDIENGFTIVGTSTPPRGFYTGTCSNYDTTFGCHFLIPADISDALPLPQDEAIQHLCID